MLHWETADGDLGSLSPAFSKPTWTASSVIASGEVLRPRARENKRRIE
jgi:hypothetical protein